MRAGFTLRRSEIPTGRSWDRPRIWASSPPFSSASAGPSPSLRLRRRVLIEKNKTVAQARRTRNLRHKRAVTLPREAFNLIHHPTMNLRRPASAAQCAMTSSGSGWIWNRSRLVKSPFAMSIGLRSSDWESFLDHIRDRMFWIDVRALRDLSRNIVRSRRRQRAEGEGRRAKSEVQRAKCASSLPLCP